MCTINQILEKNLESTCILGISLMFDALIIYDITSSGLFFVFLLFSQNAITTRTRINNNITQKTAGATFTNRVLL